MAMAPALPKSSGVAIASLILGILGISLAILAVILGLTLGVGLLGQLADGPDLSLEEISRLAEDPSFQAESLGIQISLLGGMLAALLGFILGIVGIAREGGRPTQSGKTVSIFGLIVSALPLLCCCSFVAIAFLLQ